VAEAQRERNREDHPDDQRDPPALHRDECIPVRADSVRLRYGGSGSAVTMKVTW
jgi:hypothetical protein